MGECKVGMFGDGLLILFKPLHQINAVILS